MNNLFSLTFWFNLRPAPFGHYSKLAMATFIILLVAFFVYLKIMKDRGYKSRMWSNLADFTLTNLILACILMFFSLELVPFFSAKFWLLLWLAEIITWLTLIFKRIKSSKAKKEELEKEKIIKKYLPK